MHNAEPAAAAYLARRQFAFLAPLPAAAGRYLPTTVIAAVALLIAVRRLSGAVTQPLSLEGAALTSLVATLAALGAALNPAATRVSRLVTALSLLLLAGCLTVPGSSLAATVLLFLPSTAVAGYEYALSRTDGDRRRALRERPSAAKAGQTAESRADATAETVRYVDASGRNTLVGTFVAEFEAGRRTAAIHVAFCPPFARTPTVESSVVAAAAGSADVQLKTTSVLPYAARVEIRLPSPAVAATVVRVRIVARETLRFHSIEDEDSTGKPPR